MIYKYLIDNLNNLIKVNLDKSVLDGTLFNKMLNVKNTGEWMNLTQKIINDHFMLKNKRSNFELSKGKMLELCNVLASQSGLSNNRHKMFIENFKSFITLKFDLRIMDLTDKVRLMLRKGI